MITPHPTHNKNAHATNINKQSIVRLRVRGCTCDCDAIIGESICDDERTNDNPRLHRSTVHPSAARKSIEQAEAQPLVHCEDAEKQASDFGVCVGATLTSISCHQGWSGPSACSLKNPHRSVATYTGKVRVAWLHHGLLCPLTPWYSQAYLLSQSCYINAATYAGM